MHPYTPRTKKGRTVARDDIHHLTADQGRTACRAAAKSMRHAARQDARRTTQVELASG